MSEILESHRERMRRFGRNARTLVERLGTLGYQFGSLPGKPGYWHEPVFDPASVSEREEAIRQIEARVGVFPPDLRAFYLELGSFSLLGFHPAWPEPDILDPFSIAPITGDWLRYHLGNLDVWAEEQREDGVQAYLVIAPDALHKGNISGGPPYTVRFEAGEVKETVLELGERTLTLTEYLTACCRWGGFPGLQEVPEMAKGLPLAGIRAGLIEL